MEQNNFPDRVITIPRNGDFLGEGDLINNSATCYRNGCLLYIFLELSIIQIRDGMAKPQRFRTYVLRTADDNRDFLIRLIVGLIFFSEGIQKFLFPELLGTGRFVKIGFADPAFWAYFTAVFEMVCGIFILIGFYTRLASIPLFIIMATAFITTKWPMLMDKGFWAFAHEYRTDFAMTLLLIWLMIIGAGRRSVDAGIMNSKVTRAIGDSHKSQKM
jgi:putative oxidoreductase